jgi:hypothetical protein
MNDDTTDGVHWSFWVVGGLAVLWNAMGCANFISQMNAENVSAMPDSYRAIVEGRPAWATAAFAIAVFGGVLGGLLLLLRRSVAYTVFIASVIAAAVAQVPVLGMDDFPAGALIGGLTQVVVGALLVWYSKHAADREWTR